MVLPCQAITTGHTWADGDTVTGALLNTMINSATLGVSEVGTTNIADSAVTEVKLANGAVTTNKITDANVTMAKLGVISALSSETVTDDSNDYIPYYSNADAGNRKISLANLKGNFTLPAGVIVPYGGTTPPTGWLLCSGGTIGSATSGGTLRANADTSTLYTLLWESTANTELIIQDSAGSPTVRGANAAADFAANKRMPVYDMRGRAAFGKDNMGGSAASRITASGTGNPGVAGATLGAAGGLDRMTLTLAQSPSHTHTPLGGGSFIEVGVGVGAGAGTINVWGTAATTSSAGGDAARPQLNPAVILNYIIKY